MCVCVGGGNNKFDDICNLLNAKKILFFVKDNFLKNKLTVIQQALISYKNFLSWQMETLN